jgi:hypothetical protein
MHGCHCKASVAFCQGGHHWAVEDSGSASLSLLYWIILSLFSLALTGKAVIEYGLFLLHPRETLTPDFIDGDGI